MSYWNQDKQKQGMIKSIHKWYCHEAYLWMWAEGKVGIKKDISWVRVGGIKFDVYWLYSAYGRGMVGWYATTDDNMAKDIHSVIITISDPQPSSQLLISMPLIYISPFHPFLKTYWLHGHIYFIHTHIYIYISISPLLFYVHIMKCMIWTNILIEVLLVGWT